MRDEGPTDQDYATLAAFRQALREFAAFSEAAAKRHGLTPRQHQALLALRGMPAETRTATTLAASLLIRHNTAVELLDRLEAAGLVARAPGGGDRRRSLIRLTPRADELLAGLSAAHLRELRAIRPGLLKLLRTM